MILFIIAIFFFILAFITAIQDQLTLSAISIITSIILLIASVIN